MELLGGRWDRWDGVAAAAAVTLIVVSYKPWWALNAEPLARTIPQESLTLIWNAWSHWAWSGAVALGTLAVGVHLAYRGRREARGAAWLAVLMLVAGLSLVGWQWQRASDTKVKDLSGRTLTIVPRDETPEEYRRRMKEEEAFAVANAPLMPTRSIPQRGIYAAAGSLIVMLAAFARGLVRSQPKRASAG